MITNSGQTISPRILDVVDFWVCGERDVDGNRGKVFEEVGGEGTRGERCYVEERGNGADGDGCRGTGGAGVVLDTAAEGYVFE